MKFAYTILYVKQMQRTLDFYTKAFGFEVIFATEGNEYAALDTGDTKLAFITQEFGRQQNLPFEAAQADKPAPGMEIAFATDDVQKAYDAALAHGATAVCEPTQKPWGQTVAHVRDLDGFLVELSTTKKKRCQF